MPPNVLLVVNCQRPPSDRNRRVLRALYGDRFPAIAFTAWATCPPDDAGATIATRWEPRLRDNLCACCAPRDGPHPAGLHATHPRLVDVAAASQGYEYVVFVEDDCLLSPRLDPAAIGARMAGADVLIAPFEFRDRDDGSWVWTRHPTGYPAFDAASAGFDRRRLLRHWAGYSGGPEPPVLYVPMFGGFVDALAFRAEFLRRLVPDLVALQDVWHEAAIPTAILHRTGRIGRLDGLALWGRDRLRPRAELFGLLAGRDFVHPIKLAGSDEAEVLAAYRRA